MVTLEEPDGAIMCVKAAKESNEDVDRVSDYEEDPEEDPEEDYEEDPEEDPMENEDKELEKEEITWESMDVEEQPKERKRAGPFTLTITSQFKELENCLVDSGASYNLMPKSIYDQMKEELPPLLPTRRTATTC